MGLDRHTGLLYTLNEHFLVALIGVCIPIVLAVLQINLLYNVMYEKILVAVHRVTVFSIPNEYMYMYLFVYSHTG